MIDKIKKFLRNFFLDWDLKEMAIILSVIFTVQMVWYQPFYVPSGSMYPTMLIGDYLVCSKTAYGYSRYSIYFAPPLFEGRLFPKDPKRGDVVVFRLPDYENKNLIKRLIGLPGDRIQMIGGILHINGQASKLDKIENFIGRDDAGAPMDVPQYTETLPDGFSHKILKTRPFGEGRYDNTPEYIVPPNHYFVMGDNRDNSDDSRNLRDVGYIPFDFFIGRADAIWFSTGAKWWEIHKWISDLRPSRFFTVIR